jgi:peptide chain release factor
MELIQISAGRGPLECSWAVWKIFERFCKAAKTQAISATIVDKEPDLEKETYKSIIVSLTGENLKNFYSDWIGTIQWTAQSPFRPQHKRKNWFVSINLIPILEEESFSMTDVKIETMRSSGAGGQHVNKTESCVRVTHIPSKTVVVIADQRSQHQNKIIALAILMNKIQESRSQKQELVEKQHWQNHNVLIRGNPVRKFTE